jgi:hypothetical protein
MAKAKGTSNSQKVTFGKRRRGTAKKNHNKNNRKEKNYRGQGR